MKNLKYKKQILFGVSLIVFITVLVIVIIALISKNQSVLISSNDIKNTNEIIIPDVTVKNTTFKISDITKPAESVNVSAINRLTDYNLLYCIKFDNNASSEINNEDYLVFNDLILILEENCTLLFKYGLDGNYSNQAYEIKVSNIKKVAETSEKVTERELEEEKVDKKDTTQSTSPYFIKVNYKANVVTIYTKDNDGNYTVPYKAMVCSCGTYTPTSGTYKTTNKYVWRPLIHNVYGHYATRIVGSILFHSVPYTSNKNDTLLYEEYDKLGQTASEGCVRLTVQDAKWIYNNCPSGTMVEFYADSNPGPLGKPSAQKISSNLECRNWDPTDPASKNPWRTYKTDTDKSNSETNIEKPKNDTNTSINNSVSQNTNTSVSSNSNTINNSVNANNATSNSNSNNTTNNVTNNSSNEKNNNTTTLPQPTNTISNQV